MENFKPIYTVKSNLNKITVKNGQLIIITDVPGIYFDMNDIRYKIDQIQLIKESERTSMLTPIEGIYFTTDTYVFWYYDDSWHEINNIINDSQINANTVYSSEKINSTYAKKMIEKTITLNHSDWTGDSSPFTITIPINGITLLSDISIIPLYDWTQTEVDAWVNAMIISATQDQDSVTLKAYGEKPSIDLTVKILIGDDVCQ